MWISRTNFEIAKMEERLEGMVAQRAYSAAHFNGAIYDLQHELALEMNKVVQLQADCKTLADTHVKSIFNHQCEGEEPVYKDSDSLHSYHVVQVYTSESQETISRIPVTSDEKLEDAIRICNARNSGSSTNPSLHYEIEVF